MKNFFTPKIITILAGLLILVIGYFNHAIKDTIIIVGPLSSVWIAITIHELGHVIFGKIAGFEFNCFTTGPILIEKNAEGIKLRENKSWEFAGGMALMMPPFVQKEKMGSKQILYSAGGPILSLLFSLISFILYNQMEHIALLFFSLVNLGIFVVTMIPSGKGESGSDGYFIFLLLKNNEKSLSLLENTLIYREFLSNKKPNDWNEEYIQLAKQKAPSIDNIMYATMVYYYEIEKNGFISAKKKMEEYTTISITKQNSRLLSVFIHMQQLAYFLTDYQDNQFKSIKHLQQFLSPIEPVSFYRGQCIIAYLQNDISQASEYLQKVKKIIEKNEPIYGFFKVERTLTEMVEEKILSPTNNSPMRSHNI
ncbi:M50 family metallopeptidase [Priestia filamentosa]|uniref:M50 family metallopeptidase n=1 Tax=Priestia filamentosa TaxID=1402861 RepID=UPI001FB23C88|nr:M50 family metallopeptidase [Priestia filamentosa]UOE58947.1 M50 family metallopeptidase [Priestia filamentosa]